MLVNNGSPRPGATTEASGTLKRSPPKELGKEQIGREPEPDLGQQDKPAIDPDKVKARMRLAFIQGTFENIKALLHRNKEGQLPIEELSQLINTLDNAIDRSDKEDVEPTFKKVSEKLQQLKIEAATTTTVDFNSTSLKRLHRYIDSMQAACETDWDSDTIVPATERNETLFNAVRTLYPAIQLLNNPQISQSFHILMAGVSSDQPHTALVKQLDQLEQDILDFDLPKNSYTVFAEKSQQGSPLHLAVFISHQITAMRQASINKEAPSSAEVNAMLTSIIEHISYSNVQKPEHCQINLTVISELRERLDGQALDFNQWQKILIGLDQLQDELHQKPFASNGDDADYIKPQVDYCHAWCQAQSETALQPSGAISLNNKADMVKIFAMLKNALHGLNPTLDQQLAAVMTTLLKPATDQPHQDWAEISLAIEALEKHAEHIFKERELANPGAIQGLESTYHGLKLDFFKQNLAALVSISNQRWAEHAKALIVNNLLKKYTEEFSDLSEQSDTTIVSAESNLVPGVKAKGNITSTKKDGNDIEGNYYVTWGVSMGGTGGLLAGVNPLGLTEVSAAKVEGSLAAGISKMDRYSKLEQYILHDFDELLKKHRGDPTLIPFTCRHSTLEQENETGDKITVQHFDQIRKRYQAGYQRMNSHFELLRSLTLQGRSSTLRTQLTTAAVINASPVKATIVTGSGTAVGTAGLEVSILGHSIGGINASGLAEVDTNKIFRARQTPMIERFSALVNVESALENQHPSATIFTQESEEIVDDPDKEDMVDLAGLQFKEAQPGLDDTDEDREFSDPIMDSYQNLLHQKEQIIAEVSSKSHRLLKVLDEDHQRYQRERQSIIDSKQPLPQRSFLSWLWDFLHLSRSNKKPQDGKKLGGNLATLSIDQPLSTGSTLEIDLEKLKNNVKQLKTDFSFYSTLQAQFAQKAIGSVQSIQAFHNYYHAKNAEDCLYHLQLLAMNTAVQLYRLQQQYKLEAKENNAAIENLKQELLQLEKNLNKPDFEINHQRLLALTSVKERVTTFNKSIKFALSSDLGLGSGETQRLFRAKGTASVEITSKAIPIPLRSGVYKDLQYSTGWLANLGTADAATEYFSNFLANRSQALTDLPSLRQELNHHLTLSAGTGTDTSYTRRYLQPDLFKGIESTWLYTLGISTKNSTKSLKIPVPFVTVGLDRVDSRMTVKSFQCSPHTTLHFMMIYNHDYIADKRITFEEPADELGWKPLKEDQREALEGLFRNVAATRDENPDKAAIKLKHELDSIHSTLKDDLRKNLAFSDAQRKQEFEKIDVAQKNFIEAAQAFNTGPQTQANYEQALDRFERLMFAYSPHLNHMRIISNRVGPAKLSLKNPV